MLFPTVSFAIFFTATFLLYWLCISSRIILGRRRTNHLRKFLLLLASYIFYGIWDWSLLPLLIGSTLFNYLFAKILLRLYQAQSEIKRFKLSHVELQKENEETAHVAQSDIERETERIRRLQKFTKWILALAIGLNLSLLIFFKYTNWLLINLNIVLNSLGLPLLFSQTTIILPLGISFFIFQNISFLMDIYRRRLLQSGSYLDYSLYIAFFPQLIAGPIVRASSILPQLQRLPHLENIYLSDAFTRIFSGLFKKIFIANTLSTHLVDPVFLVPSDYSSLELLLAAYAYSAVIYCDFSAYSDMAVGLGLLCGIRLMENFDRPYRSNSLQSFWRGWHISLSSWLRDYLYISLGGNRTGNRYLHIFFTMLLGGLWHGASYTFLFWGALHGGMISLEHFLRLKLPQQHEYAKWRTLLQSFFGWLYSFHFVTLTWIFFRAPNFSIAGSYFAKLLSFDSYSISNLTNVTLIAIGLGILPQIFTPKVTALMIKVLDILPIVAQILIFASTMALLQILLPEGIAPFIYYQF